MLKELYNKVNIFIPGFLLFEPGSKFESKLEFKKSSAVGDSSKDSTEGSGQVELRQKEF